MRKGKIILFSMIPILLLFSGWVLFNRLIRPNHYQLLFPYSIFTGRNLVVTNTRIGADDRLQVQIPAGKAALGWGEYSEEAEISGFWIDQVPVTVAAYKAYAAEANVLVPHYRGKYAIFWNDRRYESLPVVFVSWGEAEAYCKYYGGHLPTEAQWEKAARGAEGIILYWDDSQKAFDKANYDNFYNGTVPAGWLPKGKTLYGVLDMSGNVREWVLDWFVNSQQTYNLTDWESIESAPFSEWGRILKGGAFSDDVSHLRLFYRDAHPPNSPGINRGFRCVYE